MIKIVILLNLLFAVIATNSWAATTWYVRDDGGTSSQCTGTTNAAYSGSGTGQACAFIHPAYALGTGNAGVTGVMAGGDTLIIKDTASSGGQATYAIGAGMPNTSSCSLSAPYDWPCTLRVIPSGPDSSHPTRILGSSYASCTSKPQLWGTQSVGDSNKGMLNASSASNIDIECIEFTDHSSCGFRLGATQCNETYGGGFSQTYSRGPAIYAKGGTNFTLKNIDVHGLSDHGLHIGGINGLTLDSSTIDGNHGINWDGDVGEVSTESSFSGTINILHTKFRFSGCREAYPRSSSFTASDYNDCTNKDAADGAGFYNTAGTWNVIGSEFSHNSSDGFDLLYCNATGDCNINIDKSLFEGNWGNQLKFSGKTVNVTNSVIIANCTYLVDTSKNYASSGMDTSCRANGTPISATAVLGSAWTFYNDTGYTATNSGGSAFIEVLSRYGTCNGSETYVYKNNVLYNHNHTWTAYYNGLAGACSTAWNNSVTTNSDVYNFTSSPSGTGVVTSNPLFVSSIVTTLDSNLAKVYLQAGSPAKGAGASGLSFWNSSSDYNSFAQNSPVDMGALQYGSTPSSICSSNGSFCSLNGDCCSTYCVSNACSATPACINNGNSCSINGDCCSGNCSSGFCAIAGGGGSSSGIRSGTMGKTSTMGKVILF